MKQFKIKFFSFARRIYFAAPLSNKSKNKIIHIFYKIFGSFFSEFPHYQHWKESLDRGSLSTIEPCIEMDVSINDLHFPYSSQPLVSIIIPCFGNYLYTLKCLYSISVNLPKVDIEIILIEDSSDEILMDQFSCVEGIRYYKNSENLGFIRTCNFGATLAKGEFLYFLNNDTEVLPGWLDAMLAVFRDNDKCGSVGSKLIYPNGKLQEAGGIVWSDGSAYNYGRYQDQFLPEYNYLKESDYSSGASLLTRKDVFFSVGQFDELYLPAYYEDTDYAFKIRKLGLKHYYQPNSVLVHHEGVSNGTNLNSHGVKSYQLLNKDKFYRKWRDVLQSQSPYGQFFLSRDRSMGKKTIVILDHYIPKFDRDAGSKSILAIIESLIRLNYNVKFWPHNLWYEKTHTNFLQQKGIEVFYGETCMDAFENWMKENSDCIDAVMLNRPDIAFEYITKLQKSYKKKIIYYGHDIHFQRLRLEYEYSKDKGALTSSGQYLKKELSIWRSADISLYPSLDEANTVKELVPLAKAKAITPFTYSILRGAEVRLPPLSAKIIFVAGFGHRPNIDAAIWLVSEILPLVRKHHSKAEIFLIGSNPPSEIRALSKMQGVYVTGFVSEEELNTHYSTARVAIVPLRFGAGVKNKLIEALATGTPVVATEIGVQGVSELRNIIPVSNDAAQIASHVARLIDDDRIWKEISRESIDYVKSKFSKSNIDNDMRSVFDTIGLL